MQNVKLIVLDLDGTLTDGVIHYDSDGGDHKHFHVADGLGIVMAQAAGLKIAIVTGRESAVLARRADELKIADVIEKAGDKAEVLRGLMQKYELRADEIAFVGDDLNDLPAFDVAGVKIAVGDAAQTVKDRADWVTPRAGGRGAVRDAIEEILRRQGKLDDAIAAYLARIAAPAKTETRRMGFRAIFADAADEETPN